jgi:transcription-repair coupling factor (superfamily II helicase)
VLFTAESAGRREVLLELLERLKLRPKTVDSWPDFVAGKERLAITIAPLDEGCCWTTRPGPGRRKPAVRPARDAASSPRKRADANNDAVIKNLTELREGAPVVHIDHGVGRYLGLPPWKSTTRPPNSSPWNTPRAPSSTCRWPTCT